MTLRLDGVQLLNAEEKAQLKDADELIAEVKAKAEELGVSKYPKPRTAPPNLTELDVAELPNNQLGQIYTQYTAHAQYIYGELAHISVAHKYAVASMKQLEAKLKAKMYASSVPKAEVPALMREDGLHIAYELEVLRLFAMKELLEAHYRAYSKQAEALSRIIALRELEFGMQTRDAGIQNRKVPQRPNRDFRR